MSFLLRGGFQTTSVEEGYGLEGKWSQKSPGHVEGEDFVAHLGNSPSILCALTSLQEIPSTCRDALTLTLTQSRQSDFTGTSCGGSACIVTQDAHTINLRTFRDGTLFAEDSVYVPAVGESECRRSLLPINGRIKLEPGARPPFGAELSTSDSTGLPQVSDIEARTHEGVILVSWKAPDQPVSGYMIDYTHDGRRYHWKETKRTNVALSGGRHG